MNQKSALARIIFTKTVNLYFWELINVLYQKNYFSYKDSARMYVLSLRQELEVIISFRQKYKAPPYFSRYGKDLYYVTCSKNRQTTWYFFFTIYENNTYIIRYITNNHVAGHLI